MAASAEDEGKSLYDWLIDMYVEHGFYKEGLINLVRKGQQGEQEIKAMMAAFRNNPPVEILGQRVARALDYLSLQEKNLITGNITALDFPKSDVVQFYLEDGTKISVRPSGTEPKIKFYISVNTKLGAAEQFDEINARLDARVKAIENYLMSR